MKKSDALARVNNHTHSHGPRQEGIYLSLVQLRALIDFLESDADSLTQGIDYVAFMIGKKELRSSRPLIMPSGSTVRPGRSAEYTVEVLPFKASYDASGAINKGGNFMTGLIAPSPEVIIGFLDIPGQPFDNSDGGGGGNQKTPPPTT